MIKHILSIIWNQRRSNGWIFAELLVVAGVFWLMVDMFYVDTRTYYSPLGFDITNVWRFKLSEQERNPSDSLPGVFSPLSDADHDGRAGEADPLDVANTPMVRGGGSLRYLLLLSLLDGKFLEGDRASGW